MHAAFAAIALPLVSIFGMLFVVSIAARDQEGAPISLSFAILCGAIITILSLGIHNAPPVAAWAWPAVAALCIGLLACGAWEHRADLSYAWRGRRSAAGAGPFLTGLALIAATEELLFRGLMQSSLVSALSGPGGAVTATFLLNLSFAGIHARRGMTFALSAGFFGMIMSMTVILSGSVWPAVLTHVAWNLMIGIARTRYST